MTRRGTNEIEAQLPLRSRNACASSDPPRLAQARRGLSNEFRPLNGSSEFWISLPRYLAQARWGLSNEVRPPEFQPSRPRILFTAASTDASLRRSPTTDLEVTAPCPGKVGHFERIPTSSLPGYLAQTRWSLSNEFRPLDAADTYAFAPDISRATAQRVWMDRPRKTFCRDRPR